MDETNNDKKGKNKKKKTDALTSKVKKSCKKMGMAVYAEGISKTKQLAAKTKESHKVQTAKFKSSEPRICGNGKPMPSLAELEKMYEDSDDELDVKPDRVICKTPDKLINNNSKILSPKTLQKLSNKVMEIISNISDTTAIVIEDGPPPIVPPLKPIKSGIPYIVGCKDRPRIPEKSKPCNVGKGEKKYGVDYSLLNVKNEEDEDLKKKKRKLSKIPNIQYSPFNAKCDEIANMLKKTEQLVAKYGSGKRDNNNPDNSEANNDSNDDSNDSNKTLTYYDTVNSPPAKKVRFSPIPSTSTNMEVFLKNDEKFNESLMNNSLCSNITTEELDEINDIQIIETPCVTIDVDDSCITNSYTLNNRNPKPHSNFIEIDDSYLLNNRHNKSHETHSNLTEIDNNTVLNETHSSLQEINNNPVLNDRHPETHSSLQDIDNNPVLNDRHPEIHSDIIEIDDNPALNNRHAKTHSNPIEIDDCIEINNLHPIQNPEVIDLCNETLVRKNIKKSERNIGTIDLCDIEDVYSSIDVDQLDCNTSEDLEIIDIDDLISQNEHLTQKYNSKRRNSVMIVDNNSKKSNNVTESFPPVIPITSVSNQKNSQVTSNSVSTAPIVSIPNEIVPPVTSVSSAPIISLPRETVSQVTLNSVPSHSTRDCPICLDSLATNVVAATVCGHIFCMSCIKVAVKLNGKKCPTCRKKLTGIGYHPLFL